MTSGSQAQIDALQGGIRRAGLLSIALRLGFVVLILLVAAGWGLWQHGLTQIREPAIGLMMPRKTPELWREGPGWAMFLDEWHRALAVAGVALLAALACMKIISPWLRRRELRQQLARLPEEQRAQVLRPLQQDRSRDTRRLASALAHELGLSTEITPAVAPDARGHEASPAAGTS